MLFKNIMFLLVMLVNKVVGVDIIIVKKKFVS